MNIIYSQTCTANAGGDLSIILDHDGSPGGEITFDGTETTGENLGLFEWEIYHLPEDTLAYTANGSAPIIDINCYTSLNEDDTWTDCLADYRVELTVACDDGSTDSDIINLSVTEANDPPTACLTMESDSYLTNEALLIPNDNGIPGNDIDEVLLYLYIEFADCPQPDTDLRSWLWYDGDENIAPIISLGEGVYVFTHRVKDPYETYSELLLTLELNEENTIPFIEIAAVHEEDTGLDQIVIDSDEFDLFGFITDLYNDVDDIDADGTEDDIIYNWNYSVVPEEALTVSNQNTMSPTVTAPSINSNIESAEITITLEAQDPFQILDGESSVSGPIVITVVNDNTPPEITNSIEGYEIIEDNSSELNYADIDDFIDVNDTDENSFTLVISQADIDSDPETYNNYSLTGETTIVPEDDYYGQITVPVRLDDGYIVSDTCYNCLSDITDLVIDIIAVNDAPELDVPETLTTIEDTDLTITEISVEDVDSQPTGINNFNLDFEITVEKGTLSLSSNTGAMNYSLGDGTEDVSMIFSTTVSNFNNALLESTFHPEENYYGTEGKIIISVNDTGNNGIQDDGDPVELTDTETINIEITNDNDAPVITASESYTIDEDEDNFYLTDIELSDQDVADGQMILELTVSNGFLELSSTDGITCLGAENCFEAVNNMQYRGTLDVLNNSIDNLHYFPEDDYNGLDVLQIRLNDMGNVGDEELEDIKNINININPVNDSPLITSAGVFSAFEDSLFNIENISIEDVDIDEGDGILQLTIDCADCKVSLPPPIDGINFVSGNGFENNFMIFTGAISDINDAVEILDVIGDDDFCGLTNLQIIANDMGNYSGDSVTEETHTVNISLEIIERNDPPVNEDAKTGIISPPAITFSEDALSLSTSNGLWNDLIDEQCGPTSIITYEYQWQRCTEEEEEDCEEGAILDITDAVSNTYDMDSADADSYLRSRVIASDDGWGLPLSQSDTAYSAFVKLDNLPPFILPEFSTVIQNTYEDSVGVINLSFYAEDPDGNDLTFSIVDDIDADYGEIELNANNGEVEFNPATDINFNSIGDFVEFTYKVSDFQYSSAETGLIKIKILPRNDSPVFSTIDPGGFVSALENEENIIRPWTDPLSIDDGDAEDIQELEFIIQSVSVDTLFNEDESGNLISIDAFSGDISFELADNVNGSSDIRVVLKDNGGTDNYLPLAVSEFDTSDTLEFTIQVTPINDPPLFDMQENISIFEDAGSVNEDNWAFNMDDGDPEADQQYQFIVDVIGQGEELFIDLPSIDPSSGQLSFTAGADMNGEVFVEVFLDDDGLNNPPNIDESARDTFQIIIHPVNDAPTFSILYDVDEFLGKDNIIYEDSGPQVFPNFAQEIYDGDPLSNNADIQEIQFGLSTTNSGLFSVLPEIDDNGTLTFTTAENENGDSIVEVILQDMGPGAETGNGDMNLSNAHSFKIHITEINDPPFFNLYNENTGTIIEDGDDISDFEDFSDPNSISIISERYGTPDDEDVFGANAQSVEFSIEPDQAVNDNGEVFANLEINPVSGAITFIMLPHGNGESSFTVTATDTGPGEDTGNGDINFYTQSFDLEILPLADHPEIFDPAFLIEPIELKVDSLISIDHGTWTDTIDTDMSGSSSIVRYEYKWEGAEISTVDLQCAGENVNPYLITDFHTDSLNYVIKDDDAHKCVRAIVKAFDDGVGQFFDPADSSFTDTTDWTAVLNTRPVAKDDLEYFTWEDVPLVINVADGLLGDDPSDTTNDYDEDLDDIDIHLINDHSVWGDLFINNEDGSFSFDPSPSDTFGILSFTYQLIDEYGATSNNLANVQIEVGSLNDAPEFTIQNQENGNGESIEIIEVLEDFEEIKLGFSIPGHLPLNEAESQTVQYSIDPPSVEFVDLLFDQDDGSIEISSIPDWNGEQQFIVTATDDGPVNESGVCPPYICADVNSFKDTFHLKVVPVNDVPVFSLLGDTITILEDRGLFDTLNWIIDSDAGAILEGHQVLDYDISYINDQDVNGDVWTFSSNPDIINDYDLNFQVSDNHNGLSEVSIYIFDDGGTTVDYLNEQNYEVGIDESDLQTFYIEVLPVNDPPTYNSDSGKILDEDSGSQEYPGWITDISPGPPNESFQHENLYFNITAYDKFNNKLEGPSANPPNNFLFKTLPQLTIDETDSTIAHLSFELKDNHNGLGYLEFNLHDQGGVEYSGIDTSVIENSYIFVKQNSDKAEDFSVYPETHEYAIDPSTFFIDSTTTIEYFRLPYQEFAPDVQIPEKMRFSWERNDSLDLDTDPGINLDTLYSTYYRLEMNTDNSDYTYVLFDFYKDSIEYTDNLDSNGISYWVDIDMNSKFPVYVDSLEFIFDATSPYIDTLHIDTTGFTQYQWNIVTQNYSRDFYGDDTTNSTASDRNVVIDLKVPIAQYLFAYSDLYEEYYDLYFETSEETIEDIANLWIKFNDDTPIYKIPTKIDDYYFHLSSTFLDSGLVSYNFQVRDLVENVGKTEKTITFSFFENGLSQSIHAPDGLFSLYSSANSVNQKTGIILFSEDFPYNSSDIVQLTSESHIVPYDKEFIEPVQIEFNNISINDDPWKYTVMYKDNNEWIELDSRVEDDSVTSDIITGGIYSVFYNSNAPDPVPEKFELVNLYPNPFNPILTIKYNLDFEQNVSIEIYNILGQSVKQLLNQKMISGYHSIQWNGKNNQDVLLGSGIYFVKIATDNESYIRKVSFIK